jgi:hypothetical protein
MNPVNPVQLLFLGSCVGKPPDGDPPDADIRRYRAEVIFNMLDEHYVC